MVTLDGFTFGLSTSIQKQQCLGVSAIFHSLAKTPACLNVNFCEYFNVTI